MYFIIIAGIFGHKANYWTNKIFDLKSQGSLKLLYFSLKGAYSKCLQQVLWKSIQSRNILLKTTNVNRILAPDEKSEVFRMSLEYTDYECLFGLKPSSETFDPLEVLEER